MAKYRTEFKLKVVTEYLKGEMGYAALAKEYNIPNDTCLRRWVAAYRTNGTAGIARSRQQEKYSFQFKLHAVELYLSTETSYQDLAVSLGIKTPSLLAAWVQRYRAIGVDGLNPQRKGRRPQVSKEPSAKKVPADKQEEYQKRYNGLVERYEKAKARFDEVTEAIAERSAKGERLAGFIRTLEAQREPVAEFDERLWGAMVDYVTVGVDGGMTVVFRDGMTIHK